MHTLLLFQCSQPLGPQNFSSSVSSQPNFIWMVFPRLPVSLLALRLILSQSFLSLLNEGANFTFLHPCTHIPSHRKYPATCLLMTASQHLFISLSPHTTPSSSTQAYQAHISPFHTGLESLDRSSVGSKVAGIPRLFILFGIVRNSLVEEQFSQHLY